VLNGLIKSAEKYSDIYLAAAKKSQDLSSYGRDEVSIDSVVDSDTRRRTAHDAFMSDLARFQRHLRKEYSDIIDDGEVPKTGIYTGGYVVGDINSPSYRQAMTDFAVALACAAEKARDYKQ